MNSSLSDSFDSPFWIFDTAPLPSDGALMVADVERMFRLTALRDTEAMQRDPNFLRDGHRDRVAVQMGPVRSPTDQRETATFATLNQDSTNVRTVIWADWIVHLFPDLRLGRAPSTQIPNDQGTVSTGRCPSHAPRYRRVVRGSVCGRWIEHTDNTWRLAIVPNSAQLISVATAVRNDSASPCQKIQLRQRRKSQFAPRKDSPVTLSTPPRRCANALITRHCVDCARTTKEVSSSHALATKTTLTIPVLDKRAAVKRKGGGLQNHPCLLPTTCGTANDAGTVRPCRLIACPIGIRTSLRAPEMYAVRQHWMGRPSPQLAGSYQFQQGASEAKCKSTVGCSFARAPYIGVLSPLLRKRDAQGFPASQSRKAGPALADPAGFFARGDSASAALRCRCSRPMAIPR